MPSAPETRAQISDALVRAGHHEGFAGVALFLTEQVLRLLLRFFERLTGRSVPSVRISRNFVQAADPALRQKLALGFEDGLEHGLETVTPSAALATVEPEEDIHQVEYRTGFETENMKASFCPMAPTYIHAPYLLKIGGQLAEVLGRDVKHRLKCALVFKLGKQKIKQANPQQG